MRKTGASLAQVVSTVEFYIIKAGWVGQSAGGEESRKYRLLSGMLAALGKHELGMIATSRSNGCRMPIRREVYVVSDASTRFEGLRLMEHLGNGVVMLEWEAVFKMAAN